jgi:hypothetical protein
MEYPTFATMKARIKDDQDLEAEDFVDDTELMNIFNEAIRECEAHIHKLELEDIYFLTSDTPTLLNGTADYAMPTNIYANKLISVVYGNGTNIYEVKRMRGEKRFLDKAITDQSGGSANYQYMIVNNTAAAGVKFKLVPASQENSTNITRWYIRSATKMEDDTSQCDIPEFLNFIYAYVKWRVLDKEYSPKADGAKNDLREQKDLMMQTLENMVEDSDNKIIADYTLYEEMN